MPKNRAINTKMWAWAKFHLENGRTGAEVADALYVARSTLYREIERHGGYEKKNLVCPPKYFEFIDAEVADDG